MGEFRPPLGIKQMERRQFIIAAGLAAGFGVRAAQDPKALLTVGGRIGKFNDEKAKVYRFTEEEFLALPQSSITTSTTWTPVSKFEGPKLIDVMRIANGVAGSKLKFTTIDDYSANIPWEDLERYGVILAHSQNGKRLDMKRWGPLWSIYPRDQFPELNSPLTEAKFIWQTTRIDLV
jgi:hypothetical protein